MQESQTKGLAWLPGWLQLRPGLTDPQATALDPAGLSALLSPSKEGATSPGCIVQARVRWVGCRGDAVTLASTRRLSPQPCARWIWESLLAPTKCVWTPPILLAVAGSLLGCFSGPWTLLCMGCLRGVQRAQPVDRELLAPLVCNCTAPTLPCTLMCVHGTLARVCTHKPAGAHVPPRHGVPTHRRAPSRARAALPGSQEHNFSSNYIFSTSEKMRFW